MSCLITRYRHARHLCKFMKVVNLKTHGSKLRVSLNIYKLQREALQNNAPYIKWTYISHKSTYFSSLNANRFKLYSTKQVRQPRRMLFTDVRISFNSKFRDLISLSHLWVILSKRNWTQSWEVPIIHYQVNKTIRKRKLSDT